MNVSEPSPKFKRYCRKHSLRHPYVLLQASQRLCEQRKVLQHVLMAVRAVHPSLQLVEVQIGPDVGDQLGCYGHLRFPLTRPRSPGSISDPDDTAGAHLQLLDWPSPQLLLELVAHSSGAVASSLHLSLTAISFGRPVLRPVIADGGASKYALLTRYNHSIVHLPRRADEMKQAAAAARRFAALLKHAWAGNAGLDGEAVGEREVRDVGGALPPQGLRNLTQKLAVHGDRVAAGIRTELTQELAVHWDRVAAGIRTGRRAPVPLGTPRFLHALPFWLEMLQGQQALLDPAHWAADGGGVPWPDRGPDLHYVRQCTGAREE